MATGPNTHEQFLLGTYAHGIGHLVVWRSGCVPSRNCGPSLRRLGRARKKDVRVLKLAPSHALTRLSN
eukprot:6194252-Pleurochrysis_carterae.AAC.1